MRALIPTLLASVALLSACDESGPRTTVIYESVRGSEDKLDNEARAGRAIPVYAMQAPFRTDRAISEVVAARLSKQHHGLTFESVGGGLPEANEQPRILILHDTPDGYTGISACQGKPYQPASSDKEILIRAVVCDDAERLVEILGALPRAEPSLEAAYDTLLEQAVSGLVTGEDRTPK